MATLIADILTIPWLKETYLAGVNLTDANGVALPDIIFSEAITSAIRYVESVLDINVTPTIIKKERQDLHRFDKNTFWMKGTYKKPLIQIDETRLKIGNIQMLKVPASWLYQVAPNYGTFSVIPTMDQLMMGTHATQVMMAYNGENMPGALEMDYRAGMLVLEGTTTVAQGATTATVQIGQEILTTEYSMSFALVNPALPDTAIQVSLGAQGNSEFDISLSAAPSAPLTVRWVLTTLPSDIKALIGLQASIQPLNVAGTTLVGPGISTKSTSIDGLSQSVGTTANANKLAYGNRVDAHKALFDQMLPYVRGRYTGMLTTVS